MRKFSATLVAFIVAGSVGLWALYEPANAQPKKAPPKNFTNSLGMKFVWIPPGSFVMGSPKDELEKGSPMENENRMGMKKLIGQDLFEDMEKKETRQHKVTLTKGFYMGVYTVTQEQWQAVMGNNPSHFKGEKNLPVENVSWDKCQEFVKKLREKDTKPYRLPTEAEWEYSCRAGTKTAFYFGDTISTDQANYDGTHTYGDGGKGVYRKKTMPVGSFPANPWGLYDMHGNVWQFCQDWYGDYPQEDVVDPQGPDKGNSRVARGGSWGNTPHQARSAHRGSADPMTRGTNDGLRVCFFVE